MINILVLGIDFDETLQFPVVPRVGERITFDLDVHFVVQKIVYVSHEKALSYVIVYVIREDQT